SANRVGQTRLFVRQGSLVDSVLVTVQPATGGSDPGNGGGTGSGDESAPATLSLTPTHLSLQAGQSGELTATLRDAQGRLLPTGDAAWVSDDPAVVSVDGVGRLTALTEGSTQVRVIVGGLQAVSTIFVRATPQEPGGGPPSRITDVRIT